MTTHYHSVLDKKGSAILAYWGISWRKYSVMAKHCHISFAWAEMPIWRPYGLQLEIATFHSLGLRSPIRGKHDLQLEIAALPSLGLKNPFEDHISQQVDLGLGPWAYGVSSILHLKNTYLGGRTEIGPMSIFSLSVWGQLANIWETFSICFTMLLPV